MNTDRSLILINISNRLVYLNNSLFALNEGSFIAAIYLVE